MRAKLTKKDKVYLALMKAAQAQKELREAYLKYGWTLEASRCDEEVDQLEFRATRFFYK